MAVKVGMTTSKLLKSIKVRAMVPNSSITFSDEDLIDFLNEEMQIGMVESILQMKDDYLVFKEVVPIETSKKNYTIPERALGNKVREISFVDGNNEYEMTQIAVDDRYQNLGMTRSFGFMRQFYVQGSDVYPYPEIDNNGYGALAFYYYMRPNELVKDDKVATIKSIDTVNGIITVDRIPTEYKTDSLYDIISVSSPHQIRKINITVSNINSLTKTISVSVSDLDQIKVGDMIPLAGQSCIPNIPTELHVILAQRVACRILEAIGDSQGLTNANNKLQEMEGKVGILLDNRFEGSPKKVVNRNSIKTLRGRYGRTIY